MQKNGQDKPTKSALTTFAPKDRPHATDFGIRQHLSDRWVPSTKGGYSSGMKKFAEFLKSTLDLDFNHGTITATALYSFIVWAGKSTVVQENGPKRLIKADTIGKYVRAIRTWHLVEQLHKVPDVDNEIISLLLKATEKNEESASPKKIKTPVTVRMMFDLVKHHHNKSEIHNVVITLALCAFWGMARLGEFIRENYEQGALTLNDIRFGSNPSGDYIRLLLRKAKTAPPGEIQIIHLQSQPSVLDPVAAIKRLLLSRKETSPDSLLFKSAEGPINKRTFVKILEDVWGKSSLDKWTGHSFRVGGASLRHNLGTTSDVIKDLGRWESVAYLRYIRVYSQETLKETKETLQAIDKRSWT